LVNELHRLHRVMYMQERHHYYTRAERAVHDPDHYISCISDGMASNKCVCPADKDRYEFKPHLKMHIQGVLMHGRRLDIYRSFPNLSVGGNVAAHSWLLSLEEEYKRSHAIESKRSLPDTLYHQIDGGSENTAKATLALCELMVARRLTRRIILSRLPVGHTHEVRFCSVHTYYFTIIIAMTCSRTSTQCLL
jgi:hypothetical protein